MSDSNIKSARVTSGVFQDGSVWEVRTGVEWSSLTPAQKRKMRAALKKSRQFKTERELDDYLRSLDR